MVDLFDFITIDGNLSVGIFSMFVAHYLGLFKVHAETDLVKETEFPQHDNAEKPGNVAPTSY